MHSHLLERYLGMSVSVEVLKPLFGEQETSLAGKLLEVDEAFIRLKTSAEDRTEPERLIGIVNIAGLTQRT
jgi:hypothetical protein